MEKADIELIKTSTDFFLSNKILLESYIKNNEFPIEFWKKFTEYITPILYHDDAKTTLFNICCVFENLGKIIPDTGIGISMASHFGLSVPILEKYASSSIKNSFEYNQINKGEKIIAFAITEMQGGTDTFNNKTSIYFDKTENSYILNGSKWAITNMPIASYILTFAKLEESKSLVALLVDTKLSGVKIGKDMKPECMKTSPIGPVTFKNVKIQKEFLLNDAGKGHLVLKDAFFRERLIMGYFTVGIMQFLLHRMIQYANKRKINGVKIIKEQYIQKRITDSKIALEASRNLAYNVLKKYINNEYEDIDASITKIFVSNSLVAISQEALRIFGINGFKKNDMLTQLLIDSLAFTVAGGTEEIHRKVILNQTLREIGI